MFNLFIFSKNNQKKKLRALLAVQQKEQTISNV